MADGYRVLPAGDAFWRPSNQMGVLNTDLGKQLESDSFGARLWRLAPGQASTRHRHAEQVELYMVLEGTGRITVGEETLTLTPHSAILIEPGTVRQIFNDTDADALWSVAGTPPEQANTLEMSEEQLARLYPDGPKALPPELADRETAEREPEPPAEPAAEPVAEAEPAAEAPAATKAAPPPPQAPEGYAAPAPDPPPAPEGYDAPAPVPDGPPPPDAPKAPAGISAGVVAPPQPPPPRRIERPIFIVAPPRSGGTLLFETLARSPDAWSAGDGGEVIESLPGLDPANRGWDSNRLYARDVAGGVDQRLHAALVAEMRDRDGKPPEPETTGLRLLERTPKNSLRIPFIRAAFPGALFVYVHRDPREVLASMLAAWESGDFATYPKLPEWPGQPWSLLLTPEWRQLAGKPLSEVVREQWRRTTEIMLADLEKLPPPAWCVVDFAQLAAEPKAEIERICEFAGLAWEEELTTLPHSRHTLTPPAPEKWRERESEIEAMVEKLGDLPERAADWVARPPATREPDEKPKASPLRSVNTSSLPQILEQLRSSLLVTTYQTGKLIAVRRAKGGINTHFRNLPRPMGIAVSGGRMAVGTTTEVIEYRNLPQVAAKLGTDPVPHDACFVPSRSRVTGDIQIHDLAYAGGELWAVATRFSSLVTFDDEHSFVPRWRPPFVTALAAEDRCHLNGLAVVDDAVKYVSALGKSDVAGGWRENKARGGILMDVDSSEIIVEGLSMPHSPRWYRDKLWVLESGEGNLGVVDLDAGKVETVLELPGFTRGMCFAGPVAFIGLSEVREATTFGGLPLTGRLEERQCGIWAVNIETGKSIGFLRFEDLVQEIFEVALLPGMTFPEVAEPGSDATKLAYVVPDEALTA